MSTTTTDALDSWFSELTDGESSMRRLRKRLGVESKLLRDPCPTCHCPATEDAAHTDHEATEPVD